MMHFGMTGHPVYYKNEDNKPEYTRAIFHFENGYNLAFGCVRMLGELQLIEEKEAFIQEKELGPDICSNDFDYDIFSEIMENRRGMIKSSLMNQKLIAGIGNECSDEVLFQARIHPKKSVKDLNEDELRAIYEEMEMVVKTKLDCMDHHNELPDSFILKNRSEGADCPNCNGPVEKIPVSGRSGYFAPSVRKNKREEILNKKPGSFVFFGHLLKARAAGFCKANPYKDFVPNSDSKHEKSSLIRGSRTHFIISGRGCDRF